jgi:DNA repair exonuclease SbcCD nuclease subunit
MHWADSLPVVIVAGNHDRHLDLWPLRWVATRHPVVVAERPEVVSLVGAAVACLPWPSRAHLVAHLDSSNALEIEAAHTAAMQAVLAGLGVELRELPGPKILVGHVELGGAVLDSGQPVAARCPVRINEGDLLDVGADYCALGHIHAAQDWAGGRLCYAGSPRQCNFGEDTRKGYMLVEIEPGKTPVFDHRQSHALQLDTIEGEWVGTVLDSFGESTKEINRIVLHEGASDRNPGALAAALAGRAVRLTYYVEAPERAQAGAAAEQLKIDWLSAGAHSVTLDPRVVPVSRVRSEEIRTAQNSADRLEAWWSAGVRPSRAHAILEKLNHLETESTP